MSVFATIRLRHGEKSGQELSGQGIGQFADLDECRAVTEREGVREISEFYYRDQELYEEIASEMGDVECEEFDEFLGGVQTQQDWHDPTDGLKTISVLLTHFSRRLRDEPEQDYLVQIVDELKDWQACLQAVVAAGDEFRLEISE